MARFHVLTPFSRPQNLGRLARCLYGQGVGWTLLLHAEVEPLFHGYDAAWPDLLRCGPEDLPYDIPYDKLDTYGRRGDIRDDTYYAPLCDDSLYPRGFFAGLADVTKPIVIVSALRGHRVPPGRGHGCGELVAQAEHMRCGSVTLEQIFVRGDLFRTVDWADGDGSVAGWLYERYAFTDEIEYRPESRMMFNALEPGRWDTLPDA